MPWLIVHSEIFVFVFRIEDSLQEIRSLCESGNWSKKPTISQLSLNNFRFAWHKLWGLQKLLRTKPFDACEVQKRRCGCHENIPGTLLYNLSSTAGNSLSANLDLSRLHLATMSERDDIATNRPKILRVGYESTSMNAEEKPNKTEKAHKTRGCPFCLGLNRQTYTPTHKQSFEQWTHTDSVTVSLAYSKNSFNQDNQDEANTSNTVSLSSRADIMVTKRVLIILTFQWSTTTLLSKQTY